MTLSQVIQAKNLVSTYPNRGLSLSAGQGVYLISENGEPYLDYCSNFGVNLLGYGVEEINQAIKNQVDKLLNCHSSFANDTRAQATQLLLRKINQAGLTNLKRVMWSNYGAEAVDAALKFALVATGRDRLLAPRNDYHGKTLAALATTSSNSGQYQKPFAKFLLSTDYFAYNDLDSLAQIISDKHAALIIEPIQAEGGIIVPDENYLTQLSQLCRQHGVLLIIDEIQTGLGRNGRFLNVEKYIPQGFQCDMLLLGKGLGGGLPVSAVLTTEELNQKIPKGTHTSTTGGNPLSLAGVTAFLNYLFQQNIIEQSQEVSHYFFQTMRQLQTKFPDKILEIKGEGFMLGLRVSQPPIEVLKQLQAHKILALPCNQDTVRFLPPLVIQKEHVDELEAALSKIFS
jgi:acetylornithine/succinyldiaminopimelate/putrescine aminotransferase